MATGGAVAYPAMQIGAGIGSAVGAVAGGIGAAPGAAIGTAAGAIVATYSIHSNDFTKSSPFISPWIITRKNL